MLVQKIKDTIFNHLKDSKIYVKSVDEVHFDIIVVCDVFINFSLIERHRYIYNIIKDFFVTKIIHAVSLKVYTLDEWEKAFSDNN